MVQQVQQWVINTPETTLETIEAVGTSSKKLIEWRQTTGEHFIWWCTATWSIHWWYDYHTGNRSSWTLQGDMTLSTTRWPRIFIIVDKGVRVPKWWTYKLDMVWRWGYSSMRATIYVKKGTSFSDETIYTGVTYANADITVSNVLNLGKFDTISIWWDFYYSWSADYASWDISISSLTLTEL